MARHRESKRTTINDLAKLAGSSPSAVSVVLSGKWKQRRISAALAERITRIADEQGYAVNIHARTLRRKTSYLIGIIVPRYNSRYFGSIVEEFEARARERGLMPIITCTHRDPELELQSVRAMISHQINCLVAIGATDPDRIAELCAASGVRTINLDLQGSQAPSVILNNYAGALALTRRLLTNLDDPRHLLFIGGRAHDHNTAEQIRGFRDAHVKAGIVPCEELILPCGYASEKAEMALDDLAADGVALPPALFVNSTIALEGVMRWLQSLPETDQPRIGCFDWDPIVAAMRSDILMIRQDVAAMLTALFELIDSSVTDSRVVEIPVVE